MSSLQNLLTIKGNNYTKFIKFFKEKTKVNLIKGNNKKIPLTKSCSIIIPFYDKSHVSLEKNLISLQRQVLPSYNKVEIIIINDSSPIDLRKIIKRNKSIYSVIYLSLKRNYGRATARNLGLLYARNEIIIFLDADIVIPINFLASHLLRHQFLKNCIIVGFRYNCNFKNSILQINNLRQGTIKTPSYKDDFRYKKFIPWQWKNIYKNAPLDNFNKTCYLLKESEYFKRFGKDKIYGVWEMPFMFLANNASVARKYVLEVGGFDMRFKGWGLEDVHLAAKLIAYGLYLIPNLNATVYHIKRKENKEKKIKEFQKNFQLYNKLKNEKFSLFTKNEWRQNMEKYFKNKFSIERF